MIALFSNVEFAHNRVLTEPQFTSVKTLCWLNDRLVFKCRIRPQPGFDGASIHFGQNPPVGSMIALFSSVEFAHNRVLTEPHGSSDFPVIRSAGIGVTSPVSAS